MIQRCKTVHGSRMSSLIRPPNDLNVLHQGHTIALTQVLPRLSSLCRFLFLYLHFWNVGKEKLKKNVLPWHFLEAWCWPLKHSEMYRVIIWKCILNKHLVRVFIDSQWNIIHCSNTQGRSFYLWGKTTQYLELLTYRTWSKWHPA